MARGAAQLVKIGLVGAGALYALGESRKYGGIGPWLSQLASSITSGVGATATAANVAANPSAALSAPSSPGALTVSTSKPAPYSPAGLAAGRALWALRHGGDPSGFDQISLADQVTWASVALTGR